MTVCGNKSNGVCVMGKCPFVKKCCPVIWDRSKSEPLTNEEYIRTCSTEELAVFICNNLPQGKEGNLENRFFRALYSQYPVEPMKAYHEVLKWLQEEHHDG